MTHGRPPAGETAEALLRAVSALEESLAKLASTYAAILRQMAPEPPVRRRRRRLRRS